MMNTDRIHEIVSGIDPELVEEADGAGLENKKRLPRLARAGLIAACLCLALVGTGFATGLIGGFTRVEKRIDHFPWKDYHAISMWSNYTLLPLSDLPPELVELAAQHPGEYVRLKARNLPALRRDTGLDWLKGLEHEELATTMLWAYIHSSSETSFIDGGKLIWLDYQQDYHGVNDPSLRAELSVTIYTEEYEPLLKNSETLSGAWLPAEHTIETQEYVTDHGLSVLLTTGHCSTQPLAGNYGLPAKEYWAQEWDFYALMWASTYYRADFMLDGIKYSIFIQSIEHPESAFPILKELLEDFQP